VIDFLFVIIELFCYPLWLRRYKQKSAKVHIFSTGWDTLRADFRWKGTSPTNQCWCQRTRGVWYLEVPFRVVYLSTLHSVSFSFVTMHVCDGQTDGQTDRWTELQLPGPR